MEEWIFIILVSFSTSLSLLGPYMPYFSPFFSMDFFGNFWPEAFKQSGQIRRAPVYTCQGREAETEETWDSWVCRYVSSKP